jgi:hypothetical protein
MRSRYFVKEGNIVDLDRSVKPAHSIQTIGVHSTIKPRNCHLDINAP